MAPVFRRRRNGQAERAQAPNVRRINIPAPVNSGRRGVEARRDERDRHGDGCSDGDRLFAPKVQIRASAF